MVTVKLMGNPRHPLRDGVTVIVPMMSTLVVFEAAFHGAILPVPEIGIPMIALELVQLNVAPVGELIKLPILIWSLGQTEIFETGLITGVG